ncbi:MAG: MAPEG family protein [Thermosynechococcaceae cyanobacterium]
MSPLTGLITALALLLYFVLTINVGRARAKYGVPAPQTTGNLDFERYLRVQDNMLEQLVFFLPLFWLFSGFVSVIWGAVIGAIWIVGRILYAWGYYQAAEKRAPGFALSSLCSMALLLATLVKLGLLTIAEFS